MIEPDPVSVLWLRKIPGVIIFIFNILKNWHSQSWNGHDILPRVKSGSINIREIKN
jgi:hypothetical protein